MNFCVGQVVGDLHATIAVISDDGAPRRRGGAAAKSATSLHAAPRPTAGRLDAGVGDRDDLHRLLLRGP
jgi:hypothetical protein